MRFLADESCDFAVVRALRKAGHDVKTIVESCPGIMDEEVIRMAIDESRILLTEDKDFGWFVFASSGPNAAVIFIRFPMEARSSLPQTITDFVEKAGDRLAGRFVVVQPGRIRVIGLPEQRS
jgi:predicted nuclease of predicted toxin-antitoxin system